MTVVVKVGGSAGIDRAAVAADVAAMAARGEHVVLVHGASAETDALATTLGHPPRTVVSPSGQQSRRTDRRTLELFAMAALGVETFAYVELLRRSGAAAVGLFGVLRGPRKNVRAVEGDRTVLLRDDYTGKVEEIDADVLRDLLARGHHLLLHAALRERIRLVARGAGDEARRIVDAAQQPRDVGEDHERVGP